MKNVFKFNFPYSRKKIFFYSAERIFSSLKKYLVLFTNGCILTVVWWHRHWILFLYLAFFHECIMRHDEITFLQFFINLIIDCDRLAGYFLGNWYGFDNTLLRHLIICGFGNDLIWIELQIFMCWDNCNYRFGWISIDLEWAENWHVVLKCSLCFRGIVGIRVESSKHFLVCPPTHSTHKTFPILILISQEEITVIKIKRHAFFHLRQYYYISSFWIKQVKISFHFTLQKNCIVWNSWSIKKSSFYFFFVIQVYFMIT